MAAQCLQQQIGPVAALDLRTMLQATDRAGLLGAA